MMRTSTLVAAALLGLALLLVGAGAASAGVAQANAGTAATVGPTVQPAAADCVQDWCSCDVPCLDTSRATATVELETVTVPASVGTACMTQDCVDECLENHDACV